MEIQWERVCMLHGTPVSKVQPVGTVYLVAGVLYMLEAFHTFFPFGYISVLSGIAFHFPNHSLIISSETTAKANMARQVKKTTSPLRFVVGQLPKVYSSRLRIIMYIHPVFVRYLANPNLPSFAPGPPSLGEKRLICWGTSLKEPQGRSGFVVGDLWTYGDTPVCQRVYDRVSFLLMGPYNM
jgi:hypothetical protein